MVTSVPRLSQNQTDKLLGTMVERRLTVHAGLVMSAPCSGRARQSAHICRNAVIPGDFPAAPITAGLWSWAAERCQPHAYTCFHSHHPFQDIRALLSSKDDVYLAFLFIV